MAKKLKCDWCDKYIERTDVDASRPINFVKFVFRKYKYHPNEGRDEYIGGHFGEYDIHEECAQEISDVIEMQTSQEVSEETTNV